MGGAKAQRERGQGVADVAEETLESRNGKIKLDERQSFQNLIQSKVKKELVKKVGHSFEYEMELNDKAIDVFSVNGNVFVIMTGNF